MVTMLKIVGVSAVVSVTLLSAIAATAQKSAPSSKLYHDRLSERPAASSLILSASTGPQEATTEETPRWIMRPMSVEIRGRNRGASPLVMSVASLVAPSR